MNKNVITAVITLLVVYLWILTMFGLPVLVPIFGNFIQLVWLFVVMPMWNDIDEYNTYISKKAPPPPPKPKSGIKQNRKKKLNKLWK